MENQNNQDYQNNQNYQNYQNGRQIYYDPGASQETIVSNEKKKSKLPLILIVIVVVLIVACCCCFPTLVGVIYLFLPNSFSGSIPSPVPAPFHPQQVDKPVIYLYPEEQTEISVKVSDPELLTVTYPEYQGEWKVVADPNGTLTDPQTARTYYSLYYESRIAEGDLRGRNEGFLVAGEDSAEFLEEKLAILGLTDREAEEMIIYWLPQLEENDYNLIRFATREEIDEQMGLEISPAPDTLIRVWMEFEGVDSEEAETISSELTEQELTPVERSGYTAVEWGGIRR